MTPSFHPAMHTLCVVLTFPILLDIQLLVSPTLSERRLLDAVSLCDDLVLRSTSRTYCHFVSVTHPYPIPNVVSVMRLYFTYTNFTLLILRLLSRLQCA